MQYSQGEDGLLRTMQGVDVVRARVVQHGVPVRQHLDPTRADG